MFSQTLKLWLAQSSSWETFEEFRLPLDSMADYTFLGRYDDFYISLLAHGVDLIRNPQDRKKEIAEVAAGLQIHHITSSRERFSGIAPDTALLYSACFYHLADFSVTGSLVARRINPIKLRTDFERSLYAFLVRKRDLNSPLDKTLTSYLNGNLGVEKEIKTKLSQIIEDTLKHDPDDYFTALLYKHTLIKFFANFTPKFLSSKGVTNVQEIVDRLIQDGIWEFLPTQKEAIEKGVLSANVVTSLQMPTSAGKTALSELVIFHFYKQNPDKKILFLAPFRALAAELKQGFCKRLGSLGVKNKTMYGGGTASLDEVDAVQQASLIVSTPEKFLSIEAADPTILDSIGLVICDEGHLLDASDRGLSYELLLARLKGNGRKILFISAIVPNVDAIHSWLGGEPENLLRSEFRPSKLEFAYLDEETTAGRFKLTVNPCSDIPEKFTLYSFIRKEELSYVSADTNRRRTYSLNSNLALAAYTALKSLAMGPVALFTTQKNHVNDLSEKALKQVELFPELSPLRGCDRTRHADFCEYFKFLLGEESRIYRCLSSGFLFHNGDLPQSIREKIETALRYLAVRMVICTNTLAEGVNLPFRTLVIHTIKRFDKETSRQKAIPLRDIKNIVGRAGRADKALKGLVILCNSNEQPYFDNLIRNTGLENVYGSLYSSIQKLKNNFGVTADSTSEQLEQLPPDAHKILEGIDLSIISLLNPGNTEMNAEQVKALSRNTFAHRTLDADGKALLENLFHNRYEIVRPLVESIDFDVIKECLLSPIKFRELSAIIEDLLAEAPTASTDPSDDATVRFYSRVLMRHEPVAADLKKFKEDFDVEVDETKLFNSVQTWLRGGTYSEIGAQLECDVNVALPFIARVFGNQIQRASHAINAIVFNKLNDPNLAVPFGMSEFGNCILIGCYSRRHLELVSLGFTDRALAHSIADWLRAHATELPDDHSSRTTILINSIKIRTALGTHLPKLLLEEFDSNLRFLENQANL